MSSVFANFVTYYWLSNKLRTLCMMQKSTAWRNAHSELKSTQARTAAIFDQVTCILNINRFSEETCFLRFSRCGQTKRKCHPTGEFIPAFQSKSLRTKQPPDTRLCLYLYFPLIIGRGKSLAGGRILLFHSLWKLNCMKISTHEFVIFSKDQTEA